MLNQTEKIYLVKRVIMVICLVLVLALSFSQPVFANEKPTMSIAYAESDEAMAAADSIGSETVTYLTEPVGARTDCTWTLAVDESKMSAWLTNRVKEKDLSDYLQLSIDGNKCTVTALQYFKYGIKYTTYYTLTATCSENPELSAVCYITLG